jgi:hypothetical protein
MTETVTILVANRRLVEVETARDHVPQSISVAVRIDGQRRWSSEEPGWRELGMGVTAHGVYFWSARRLVELPIEHEAEATIVDAEEDILVSFAYDHGFVLVCETSVRLILMGEESTRLEMPEVIELARWQDDVLELRDAAGAAYQVAVSEGRLYVVS